MNADTPQCSAMHLDKVEVQEDYRFHIVVFSFNRAMQCESVLRSILEHVKAGRLTLSVIWHATGPHGDGYGLLRQLYEPKGVRFYERSGRIDFFRHVLPRLLMPRNLYHWLKLDYVRKADNFKPLLEQVIAGTPADFVSFNTDDNIYYRDEMLPHQAFRHIRETPYGVSYRVLSGSNLSHCPKSLRREDELLHWDYLDPGMSDQWAYPFTVDGTYFDRSALLAVIHRVLYHNPVTLESFLVSYVRSQRLFCHGYSPLHASMIAVPLNKVSYIVPYNRRGTVSVEKLNDLFLQDYRLEYVLPEPMDVSCLVPEQVIAVRGDERVVIPVSLEGRQE